jgi:alpha-1,2-mannosyltransferase
LAAAAVAAGWTALHSIFFWITLFLIRSPVHVDVRLYYVAAEAGVRYGWSTIYDQVTLRALSSGFPEAAQIINDEVTFASTPLVAWLFAPLTLFSEPVAYAIWTFLSLAALVLAWHIAAPYKGLAKFTLLLLALGLAPFYANFYFGQPNTILMALVAIGWWLCIHDRPFAAGAALALATSIKPQAVIFVPAALLIVGRYRVVASWAGGCAVLTIVTTALLGPSGLTGWWHALRGVQGLNLNTEFTLIHLLGSGPQTYLLWGLQGAAALLVVWWRRRELEIVFAAAILGTAATASYYHMPDYSNLVLAAWLVLRTSPPLWHRLWLLVGVLTMQLMDYGWHDPQPVTWHTPQLIWDAAWLGILAVSSYPAIGVALKRAQSRLRSQTAKPNSLIDENPG